MKLAIAGLGRMGMQIARKLADAGHEVVAHNRSPGPIEEAAAYGAAPANTKEAVVAAFAGAPVVLWLMLPAGVVDAELDDWLPRLPQGSTIIDGGNSDFRQTQLRAEKVLAAGMAWLDVGTSGGIWGYERGFSLMAGGERTAYETLKPVLQDLALPAGAYQYFGPAGSGHYVKMVHNAIEYGMMESIAEGYRLLKEGPIPDLDVAAAGEVWQHGSVITSWLNELARQAIQQDPNLDKVDGYVAESGEARWALETARRQSMPLPAIEASFQVRLASQRGETNYATRLLAAMRHAFGGHEVDRP